MNINEKVHELYWDRNMNCARTALICLGEIFGIEYDAQILPSAVGLHGAGGFRAQCGLVEGSLMFFGIYYSQLGKSEAEIASICYEFAETFTHQFGSLACRDLRPGGFTENDTPHICEKITCEAIAFTSEFIKKLQENCREK